MTYVVPWWSPSKFVCWTQCPYEFYLRYVQHEPMVATEALHFGTAVHRGLEAHYRGTDGARAFRLAWRELGDELRATGLHVDAGLSAMGLDLVEATIALGLRGEPERRVWLRTDATLTAPTLGYMDLFSPDAVEVVDFKTTVGAWSQERAEKEIWQPCLYSWAFWEETGKLPTFRYVVLNRRSGQLEQFVTRRTHDDIAVMLERAIAISRGVQREEFDCVCPKRNTDCPECGGHWEHGHVCEPARGLRIKLRAEKVA